MVSRIVSTHVAKNRAADHVENVAGAGRHDRSTRVAKKSAPTVIRLGQRHVGTHGARSRCIPKSGRYDPLVDFTPIRLGDSLRSVPIWLQNRPPARQGLGSACFLVVHVLA